MMKMLLLTVLAALVLSIPAQANWMEPGGGTPHCWGGVNLGTSAWYGGRSHYCTYFGWDPPLI